MLEMEAIQYKGFRNIIKNDEIVGFQVGIRFVAYRGPWLSQFRFKYIKVDGEKFGPEDCTFTLHGVEYTYDEMLQDWHVKWNLQDVCYIHVKKPGGLTSGNHKVQVAFFEIASYRPPVFDELRMKNDDDPETPENTREMIIV